MAHELERVLRAFAARPWAIDPERGLEIAEVLALRHTAGPRAEPYRVEPAERAEDERRGAVAVLRLHGPMVPRTTAMDDVSSASANVGRFQGALRKALGDEKLSAIVLDVDSPGGMIDLVPETAAMLRAGRREGRPVYAVANTMMASAAYWVASQADRVFASPSATVGSIGVRAMHQDLSGALAKAGVRLTHIHAGPRKIEGHPYAPLDKTAQKALQAEVDDAYAAFVADVAAARSVPEAVVRADPEGDGPHMGGGRAYGAKRALALGMVDEIATLDEVIAMAAGARKRNVRAERERLALI